jgi:hypothetical protein
VKVYQVFLQLLAICAVSMLLSACGTKQPLPTDEERQEAHAKVPCIIVLPVETRVNTDYSMTYNNAAVLENGADFMDSVIKEELVGKNNVRVLSNRQLTALIPRDSGSQLNLIKNVGSELKCDAVLMTQLVDYRQRVGGSYGADSPASATFTMRLISTRDGHVIWQSMFKETQQSLMSNLMSFDKAESRGFKWITVEELIRQGLNEKIEECPYL